MDKSDRVRVPASSDAVFRYQVICEVRCQLASGLSLADAIECVASKKHMTLEGSTRRVSIRSVYRWMGRYESEGLSGLERLKAPPRRSSLPGTLLAFAKEQKEKDPKVSIPELIRRAKEVGIVPSSMKVDRTTLYRACRRIGITVRRSKQPPSEDTRRFAYPHRMQMVLCDGKHFRAGAKRLKRVALIFLDDATRMVLHVIVGPSESATLFLHGLHELLEKHGVMSILFLDRGPGFIAEDTFVVTQALEIVLIHGTAAYPAGHGKIERLNQTVLAEVLRLYDGRPDIDPDCRALQLRLLHYFETLYNRRPHESLQPDSPCERWTRDPRELSFPWTDEELRRRFVAHEERKVSNDHVVSVDSIDFEVPKGLPGQMVTLQRQLLDDQIYLAQEGELIHLHPVDLHRNARERRAPRQTTSTEETTHPLPPSAADSHYQRDYSPIVDVDGGFSEPSLEHDS